MMLLHPNLSQLTKVTEPGATRYGAVGNASLQTIKLRHL